MLDPSFSAETPATVASSPDLQRRRSPREDQARARRPQTTQALQQSLQRLYRKLFLAYFGLMSLLILAGAAVSVWAGFVLGRQAYRNCDTPLATYLEVHLGIIVYWALEGCITRCILRYNPAVDGPEKPLRVKLHYWLLALFAFVWPIVGLVWILESDTCQQTNESLYNAALVVVILSLSVWAMFLLGLPLLVYTLLFAIRIGHAKRSWAMDELAKAEVAKLPLVEYDDSMRELECCVCLSTFGEGGGSKIRKLPCEHLFHEECLVSWGKVQLSCPLCREEWGRTEGQGGETAQPNLVGNRSDEIV